MLDNKYLKDFATKNQTSYQNVLREYAQHLFLRGFYTQKGSENYLFKGGTALRLVFGSPRFSQDLDFTGITNGVVYEKALENTLFDLSNEGIDVDIEESKATTGGFIANITLLFEKETVEIKNQVSFRETDSKIREEVVISSELVPSYSAIIYERSLLINQKITALADRAKPRDFYDLYFILRSERLRKLLNINQDTRKIIIKKIKTQDKKRLETELKEFLPKSFWGVITDLPQALIKEFA